MVTYRMPRNYRIREQDCPLCGAEEALVDVYDSESRLNEVICHNGCFEIIAETSISRIDVPRVKEFDFLRYGNEEDGPVVDHIKTKVLVKNINGKWILKGLNWRQIIEG